MSTPSQSQLCRLHVHSVVNQLETKELDTGIIFGTPHDLINQNLAHNIKKINVELAFDTVHCLDIWMGTRAWADKTFNEEKSLNQHCIRFIAGASQNKTNKDRDLELSDYRSLDDFAVVQRWNSLHPQSNKTYPQHTWRNNLGDLDAAGNPVVLNPPAIDRTSYTVPFAPPGFNIHDADTWDDLNAVDFERATLMHGFWPHLLRTRGFIFDEATRNASFPFRKLVALTVASPTAEIIAAAKQLDVYNTSFGEMQRDRAEHSSRLKDDEAKKRTMRSLTNRIFGPSHQQALAPFKQASDFNGIRLYFEGKFGAMTDSTVVIDEILKAFTTPSTYAKCTSVADSINTWEMLSIIYISLEHNHRKTPVARRPADIHVTRASLYKNSVTYTADHPRTPRIISYSDSRAYFLFPFELSRFSSVILKYKIEQTKKSIEHIKGVLERAEDADLKNPQRAFSAAPPKAFMVNASSEPDRDDLSPSSSSLLPTNPPPPHPHNYLSTNASNSTAEDADWDHHALAVFAENSTAILHAKPCPICILIGKARHPEERANAEKHSLFDCPVLPNIAHLPNPNFQGYPNNGQAGLPPYPSLLSKVRSSQGVGVKREHTGQPKPPLSARDIVRAKMLQRFQPANPRAHLAITNSDSPLYSSFVPTGHQDTIESKEEGTYENDFLDPNA